VYFHDVAHLAVQGYHGSRVGARELDGGLGGLDVHERLIQRDDVAHGDLPGHDLGFDETFADVG
jgi:hypothetical protein